MKLRTLIGLTTALASGISVSAHAQQTTVEQEASEAEGGATQSSGLGVIVVTAERRETNLQETPLSITAIGAEELEQIGAIGLQDMQGFIPNFSISEDGAYGRSNPQFNIRGVGAGTITAGIVTERPVGLYIDGVFFPRVQGSLLNVLDAQSIEVLRGPQGTLFGRNTTGGAVVYRSKMPTNDTSASLSVQIGNFDARQIQGEVNIALTDTLYVRGVYADTRQDGYVQRGDIDLGNVDDQVGRVQLRFDPSSDFTLDLSASFSQTSSNGDARVLSEFLFNDSSGPGRHFSALSTLLTDFGEPALVENDTRLITDGYEAPSFCLWDDPNPLTFSDRCETNLEAEMQVYTARARWNIDDNFSFTSISGHIKGEQVSTNDWVWTGAYIRPFEFEYDVWSQEFQLNYDTDNLNAVAGAIYYSDSGSEREITDEIRVVNNVLSIDDIRAGGSYLRRDQEYQSDAESIGVFAQATYGVTDRFDIILGGRMSWDSKEVTIINRATPQDNDVRTGTNKESYSNFDWRVAAQYQVTDEVMIYASVTDAYKAGVANDAALERPVSENPTNFIEFVPPENARGYEVGLRSEWFDNRLRVNLTAFKTDYTDRQSRVGITDPITLEIVLNTVNLGDVEFKGLEGEFAFAATDDLTFNASFGLIDYELVETPDLVLSNVPEETFTFGAVYDRDVGPGFITGSLNYAWVGSTFGRNNALPDATRGLRQVVNPSYGRLNGRIAFTPESENWSVAFFMQNILDEYYSTSSSAQTFHIGGNGTIGRQIVRNRFVGRPRSYGVELTANF